MVHLGYELILPVESTAQYLVKSSRILPVLAVINNMNA